MAGGKNIRQIVSELRPDSIPRLRTHEGEAPAEPNPIREAMKLKEQMIAMKMVESSAEDIEDNIETQRSETEARKMEAEATKLEAQAKLEDIRARTSGQETGQMTALLMQMLTTMQEENKALRDRQMESQNDALVNLVGAFREEVKTLRQDMLSQVASRTSGDTASDIVSRIEEVTRARDALAPFLQKYPELSGAKEDISAAILMHRLNAEQEMRLAELRHSEREAEHRRELDWAKFRQDQERGRNLVNLVREVAPSINAMARQQLGMSPEPQAMSGSSQTMPCPVDGCAGEIVIVPDQEIATCPTCNTVMQVRSE